LLRHTKPVKVLDQSLDQLVRVALKWEQQMSVGSVMGFITPVETITYLERVL
jgi:hypothetical protein